MSQFKESTDAGKLAKRDDLLKDIDATLNRCVSFRTSDYEELRLASGEDVAWQTQVRIKEHRALYRQNLLVLEHLLQNWLAVSKGDTSRKTELRRGPITDLLREVQAEKVKTPEQHSAEAVERKQAAAEAEQAAAQARLAVFTVDQFKKEARVSLLDANFGVMSDVLTALTAYHALPPAAGDDLSQVTRLQALGAIVGDTGDALRPLIRMMNRPGYEQGHLGFQIEAHEAAVTALQQLNKQATTEQNQITTADMTQRWDATRGPAPATHGEGSWEVVE